MNIFKIIALTFALILSSAAHAADECSGDICITLDAKTDTVVEVFSMLFPETTSKKIFADDTIYRSILEKTVLPIDGLVRSALNYFDTNVTNSPTQEYLKGVGASDTFMSQYAENPAKNNHFRLIEVIVNLVLNVSGVVAVLAIGYVVTLRSHKIAFNVKVWEIQDTFVRQIPLFLILAGGLMSFDGTLALLPTILILVWFIGSLVASSLTMLGTVSLAHILASDSNYTSDSMMSSEQHVNLLLAKHSEISNSLAESIILIDHAVAKIIEREAESSRPSDAIFRDKFATDNALSINERCITGSYWHLNIVVKPECMELREAIELETGALPTKFNRGISGLADAAVSKSDWNLLSADLTTDVATSVIRDVADEAYRKVIARKEIICGVSEMINRPRDYEMNWFCSRFNYKLGVYQSGEYHAKPIVDAVRRNINARALADVSDKLQRKNTLGTELKFTDRSIETIKIAIEETVDDVDTKLHINANTKNIVSGMFDVLKGVSRGKSDADKLNMLASDYINSVYSAVFKVIPIVDKQSNGLDDTSGTAGMCEVYSCEIDEKTDEIGALIVDVNSRSNEVVETPSIVDKFTKKLRDSQGSDQNIYSSIMNDAELIFSTAIAFVGVAEIHKFVQTEIVKKQNPNLSSRDAKRKVKDVYTPIKSIAFFIVSITAGMFILAMLALPFYWCLMVMVTVIRVLAHVIFMPLNIIQFVFTQGDEDDAEDNVFLPPELLNIIQRCLIEPLLIPASYIAAIVTTMFAFKMGRIMVYGFTDILVENNILLYAPAMLFEVVAGFAVCGFVLLKSTSFFQYAYQKSTEYISDGLNIPMPKDSIREVKGFIFGAFK